MLLVAIMRRTWPFLFTIAMTLSAHTASGATDTLTPRVDALFQDFNQAGSPGASVMVIKGRKVVLAKGYGLANVEGRIPCGTNNNFRLASVTKQFTAMAVMILGADGGRIHARDQAGAGGRADRRGRERLTEAHPFGG